MRKLRLFEGLQKKEGAGVWVMMFRGVVSGAF